MITPHAGPLRNFTALMTLTLIFILHSRRGRFSGVVVVLLVVIIVIVELHWGRKASEVSAGRETRGTEEMGWSLPP
jgi:hypothetical protein